MPNEPETIPVRRAAPSHRDVPTEGRTREDAIGQAPASPEPPPAVARVSVNLPWKVWEVLEAMAKEDQITRTEALRRAISTEAYIWRARREGANVLIEKPDKTVERVVFPY
jgi:hypothetical protein